MDKRTLHLLLLLKNGVCTQQLSLPFGFAVTWLLVGDLAFAPVFFLWLLGLFWVARFRWLLQHFVHYIIPLEGLVPIPSPLLMRKDLGQCTTLLGGWVFI
jgi:hypothetical protein